MISVRHQCFSQCNSTSRNRNCVEHPFIQIDPSIRCKQDDNQLSSTGWILFHRMPLVSEQPRAHPCPSTAVFHPPKKSTNTMTVRTPRSAPDHISGELRHGSLSTSSEQCRIAVLDSWKISLPIIPDRGPRTWLPGGWPASCVKNDTWTTISACKSFPPRGCDSFPG